MGGPRLGPAGKPRIYLRTRQVQNLSALFETLLLLATCLWIVYEAIQRLYFKHAVEVTVNRWAFAVVLLSMAVDLSRSRALGHYARKYQSQALEADALHFSTNIWSSGVVLLGLAGAWVAGRWGVPWLKSADTLAALGVAAIIVGVSLRLGKKSLDNLLDRIPADLQERVAQAAAQVAGVLQVTKVRLRRSGPEIFADVTLSVGQATSFEKAHEIADLAAAAVRASLPRANVVVHAEPVVAPEEELTTTVRVAAARHGLGAHGIRIFDNAGRRWIELHLEVSGKLSVEEAHRQATEFEKNSAPLCPGWGGLCPISSRLAMRPPRSVGNRPPRRKSARAGRFLPQTRLSPGPAQHRCPMGRRRVAGLLPLPPGGDHGPDRSPRLDRPPGGVSPRPDSPLGSRGHSRRTGQDPRRRCGRC